VTVAEPPGPGVTDTTSTSASSCAIAMGAKTMDANIRADALKSANFFTWSPFFVVVFF
jgi:hypothetical protein